MSWKIYDEPVEMMDLRSRFFPRIFSWRGRCFTVEDVERCWTVSRGHWRRRVDRRYFRVHCGAGSFELFQDLRVGTWHLRRARLGPAPAPVVRQALLAWR